MYKLLLLLGIALATKIQTDKRVLMKEKALRMRRQDGTTEGEE